MLLGFVLGTAAHAQDLQVLQNPVLTGQPGHFTELNGVGAPAVVYDPESRKYIMVFETMTDAPDSVCPVGTWALGVATSVDGKTWDMRDQPIFSATPDTYYACVTAHPTAIIEDGQLHVWFKAEQDKFPCATERRPWGCRGKTGVGHFSVDASLEGDVTATNMPVVPLWAFGFPTVRKVDDTYHMYIAHISGTYHVTSSTPETGWVRDTTPVLTPGATWWSQTELFSPVMTCDDGDMPYKLFVGGRNRIGWTIDLGGFAPAVSADGTDFLLAEEPWFTFAGNDSWRHWDVLNVGPDDQLVWFSEKTGGVSSIGLAGTTDTWLRRDLGRCEVDEAPHVGTLMWSMAELRTELEARADDPATGGRDRRRIHRALEHLDEAMLEYMADDLDDVGDALIEAIEDLDNITTFDETSLLEWTADVAIQNLEEFYIRASSLMAPTNPDLITGGNDLADAWAAYEAGDYLDAAVSAQHGADILDDPPRDGDYCPTEFDDPLHASVCDLQGQYAWLDAEYQATGDSGIRDARDNIEDSIEEFAEVDIEDGADSLYSAALFLDSVGMDGTTLAEILADATRRIIDDAILWGGDPDGVDQAEYLLDQAAIALASGDFVTSIDLNGQAADAVHQ